MDTKNAIFYDLLVEYRQTLDELSDSTRWTDEDIDGFVEVFSDRWESLRCKILTIPYHRYWVSQSYGVCPECGNEMDLVEDKCCRVCSTCWFDNKWKEIRVLKE